MKLLKQIFAFIFAIYVSSCSPSPEPVILETVKAGKPAIWQVTGTKAEHLGTAYLFGTIHLLPKDVNWRTAKLENAITQSDLLIIEILGLEDKKNASKIFAKLAFSSGQDDIELRVKPSLRDDLEMAIDEANVSDNLLDGMETWAAALSLASAQTGNLGLQSGQSVEKKLSAQYEKLNKPIEALETIEQQLGYFDKLPETQQRQMLTSVVEEADSTKQAFEDLFNAWITGDNAQLAKLTEGGILKDPLIREKILLARNRDWAEKLDQKLKSPGTSMVAVGAGHLVGSDALQLILEKRGYKIQRIQ